jgi:hypothetical protein
MTMVLAMRVRSRKGSGTSARTPSKASTKTATRIVFQVITDLQPLSRTQ